MIFLGMNSMAQSNEKLTDLFGKKWKFKQYEIEGQIVPPEDKEKDDYILFNADHSTQSRDRGVIHVSKWKYNPEKSMLTLCLENSEEGEEMKIVLLNEKELVLEIQSKEAPLKIHLFNSEEK